MKPVDKAELAEVVGHSPFAPPRQSAQKSAPPGEAARLFAAACIVVGILVGAGAVVVVLPGLSWGERPSPLSLLALAGGPMLVIAGTIISLLHHIWLELWLLRHPPK